MAEADRRLAGTAEEQPLLGERGDASQREGKPLYYNFILGEQEFDRLSGKGYLTGR